MGFGPDNSNELNANQIGWVRVPYGYRAEMHFASDALYENAICIYPQYSDQKLGERGNYNRSLNDYSTPENNSNQDVWYRVTGWHKSSPPNGSNPWIVSSIKVDSPATDQYKFGFEDIGGEDYDDMQCTVNIVQ